MLLVGIPLQERCRGGDHKACRYLFQLYGVDSYLDSDQMDSGSFPVTLTVATKISSENLDGLRTSGMSPQDRRDSWVVDVGESDAASK